MTEEITQIPGADQFKYLTSAEIKKESGITNNKYESIKQEYCLVLALDMLASKTKIQNCSSFVNSWDNIKIFYNDMIKLSRMIPKIYIVINYDCFHYALESYLSLAT